MSILLGVDRISEHALAAKKTFLKLGTCNACIDSSDPFATVRLKSISPNISAVRMQKQPLLLSRSSRASSGSETHGSEISKTRVLQLVLKAGLASVAVCFIAALVSFITAAVTQAKISSTWEIAYSFCDGKRYNETEILFQQGYDQLLVSSLYDSIFAAWISEFCAAVVVILLYLVVGSISLSIVVGARRKLEASQVKLEQLRRTLSTQGDVKATTAGDVATWSGARASAL
jgi:hypothetical protein